MNKDDIETIEIDRELIEALNQAAIEEDCEPNQLITRILEEYLLAKNENVS